MQYDIHGNVLAKGCCEVHPWVGEDYPCSLCYNESRNEAHQRLSDNRQNEQYEKDMKDHYCHEWCMENSFLYRILTKVKIHIDKILNRISKKFPY